jgi:hypothetical protein
LFRVVGVVAGGVVIFAAAAVFLVPLIVRGISARNPAAATGTSFAADGLQMSVPAGWSISKPALVLHYETILGYLGTGRGAMNCGSDFIPGLGGTCSETISLGQDDVVLKVSSWDGPPKPAGWVGETLGANPSASSVMVAGVPAAFQDITAQKATASASADQILEWTITRPGVEYGAYTIVAYLKGPNLAASRAVIDGVVQSMALAK